MDFDMASNPNTDRTYPSERAQEQQENRHTFGRDTQSRQSGR